QMQQQPVQTQTVQQQPVCPQGTSWNGSACVGTVDTSCPAGTSFVENRGCVAVATAANGGQTCGPGMAWSGTACMVTRAAWVQQMNALLPQKICELAIF